MVCSPEMVEDFLSLTFKKKSMQKTGQKKKKILQITNPFQPEIVKNNISLFQESTFVTLRKFTS